MFGWEFPPHITGGLGTACYGMTKGLLKHGAEVLFVVPKAYGDEDQRAVRIVNASEVTVDVRDTEFREFAKTFTYMEVGSNLVPYLDPDEFEKMVQETLSGKKINLKSVYSKKYTFSGKYGTNLMEEVSRFALVAGSVAAQYDFDVIHAHDWHTYYAGIAAKKVSGKPLVVHMHATEFDRTGENVNTLVYEIEKSGMMAADRVIAVSNLTRKTVIDRYGINPEKVFTVHNAIEPVEKSEIFGIKRALKEKVVTFLGRITFQKGPEYFIETAYKVLQKDRNVRFVMAGSGDMLNKMIRRVAQLKIADRFHFTGFLQGEAVDRMFALSDVFVMPSVSEPFGLVPLEAMRTNVPVIVSKQSGVAEILKHAIKVDFWDVDGTADAIYGLLHYRALSETFKKYGKDEVDSLKWEFAAVKIMDVYKDAVGKA
ncbi:MAG: glycosyltransferase family 4 protein [Bacteroidales bacterium]|nr:glycosyltransferase family 4 protein [Bacteroidales bacterium]MCF8404339.1 glycosyltransferase family 4 protein [Bacteroidales bacterium]